jgi:hypothetical protein
VLHVAFDAISGPKGLLIPRMSNAQRASIPAPLANGLLIFNSDNNQFEYYNSSTTSWLPLLSTSNLALPSGNLYVGNGSNIATAVSMSGDAVITNTGVLTIQDNSIDGSDISIAGEANGSLAYYNGTDWVTLAAGNNGDLLAVSAGVPAWQNDNSVSATLSAGNIYVGNATNVATGVAMSGDILIDATGLTTIQDGSVDGNDLSLAAQASGSLTYHNGTEWVTLAVGTDGQFLSLSSGVPVWADVAGGSGSLNSAYTNGAAITLASLNGSVVIAGTLDGDAALELSNNGTNGIGLLVTDGLSRFGNTYTATQATGTGDLVVDNVLEVGGEVYLTGLPNNPPVGATELFLTAGGQVYQDHSSRRYKKDIKDYNFDYSNILKVNVKEYILKDDEYNAKRIGLIAEELDSLELKYLISYDNQGRPDGVAYSKMSLYLLEVVKQQQKEIESLRSEIESIKEKIK